jgi:hypothetical protein
MRTRAAGPSCARFVAALSARSGGAPSASASAASPPGASPPGRDVDVGCGRRGFLRDLAPDLTVNAPGFDPWRVPSWTLWGLRDLGAGLLRAPAATAFREGPVRALRAARFVAPYRGWRLHRRHRRR